jgi:predicted DNA-binding transcriptional regulator AlpA
MPALHANTSRKAPARLADTALASLTVFESEKAAPPSRLVPLSLAMQRYGNISRATAYRATKDGRFPPIRLAAGRAVVREDELEAFIAAAPLAAQKRKGKAVK